MTAKDISKLPFFIQACEAMDVKPTVRQARKCRQGTGHWKEHALTGCVNNVNKAA